MFLFRCLPAQDQKGACDGDLDSLLCWSGCAQEDRGSDGAAAGGRRSPAPTDPPLGDDDSRPAVFGGLDGSPRGDPRGHGIDRGLLEADLQSAGKPLHDVVDQRPASEARAGTQERYPGLAMDRPTVAAWASGRELYPRPRSAGTARPDSAPHAKGGREDPRRQPHSEGAGRRQHQVGVGSQPRIGGSRVEP